MICLALHLNGHPLCVAGHANLSSLHAHVGAGTGRKWDDPPALSVMVGYYAPSGEFEVGNLLDHLVLDEGDRIRFELVQSDEPTPIGSVFDPDAPIEATDPPPAEAVSRPRRQVKLQLAFAGTTAISLAIPAGQEHALCSVSWNIERPESCRVLARTFSGDAPGLDGRLTEWLRESFSAGQAFELYVASNDVSDLVT